MLSIKKSMIETVWVEVFPSNNPRSGRLSYVNILGFVRIVEINGQL